MILECIIFPSRCAMFSQQLIPQSNITLTALNIVIALAYKAMGISISNSEANKQVQMVRQYKKQKRLEITGSEVQKATYDNSDAAALKQNLRNSKSANISSKRNNTRNSIQKEQNANKIFPSEQKKVQNNGPKVPEYLTKPQANELKSSQQRKKTHKDWFAETQQFTNKRVINPAEKADRNSNILTVSKQNFSFGQYDWSIPGEQQEDAFRRKGLMPSMNIVLSNKFAQNPSNLSEQAEKITAKSRRQVMREVLSGKRNTADDDFKFLPNCNIQQLQISRVCKNR